ncbi:MAG: hypothetical protein EBV03_02305 [Proteobacteria bacterium]|nr:hypothetical protein [Pseudomonadota bacterium]
MDKKPIYEADPKRTQAMRDAHTTAKAKMADVHDTCSRPRGYGFAGAASDPHYTPRPSADVHPHPAKPAAPARTASAPRATDVGGGAHVPHNPAGPSALRQGASKTYGYMKDVGHDLGKAGKGALKAVAITGLAATGLFALSQMMKSPNPPRRLAASADFGDDPIVFNGGADVGKGSLAVQQVGQQQQMGNWAATRGQPEAPGQGIVRS